MTRQQPDVSRCLPGFEHVRRSWEPIYECWAARILPGQFYVSDSDEVLVTILGSCVSACVRDPRSGVGGINHFLLPSRGSEGSIGAGAAGSSAARYGNFAMEQLINEILKTGLKREDLEVKICGGGRMFRRSNDIGAKNIRFVEDYLRLEGLEPTVRDLGGVRPRRVHYFPATGRLRIKKLAAVESSMLLDEEARYRRDLDSGSLAGNIELF